MTVTKDTLVDEMKSLMNKYCIENESDTPDYVLAKYLDACLTAYAEAVVGRESFFGRTVSRRGQLDES